MSAILAVLNKHGVGLAADSAAVISKNGETKIYNSVDKIFPLSETHSVAIMIHGVSEFMQTPWDTIIMIYAKQLKKLPLTSLTEYRNDFIAFLRQRNILADSKINEEIMNAFFISLFSELFKSDLITPSHYSRSASIKAKRRYVRDKINEVQVQTNEIIAANLFCDDFVDYSYEDFLSVFKNQVDEILTNGFQAIQYILDAREKEILFNYAYQLLRSTELNSEYSGIVFVGFGESDIYPSIASVDISFSIANRLRYSTDEERTISITNGNYASIVPFAQQDVIEAFINGIDENLRTEFHDILFMILETQKEQIVNLIESSSVELADQIDMLDIAPNTQTFIDYCSRAMKKMFVNPTLEGVSSLLINDLAEMAESLVHLTYLKRRVTFQQEIVGGPIDVAVITKGNGFAWMKNKHL